MSTYWPERSSPKGFSIEQLARNYREKISKLSSEESLSSSQDYQSSQKSLEKVSEQKIADKTIHWANRQFYEYFDAA